MTIGFMLTWRKLNFYDRYRHPERNLRWCALRWKGVPVVEVRRVEVTYEDIKSRVLYGPGMSGDVVSKCWPETRERPEFGIYRFGGTDKQKDWYNRYRAYSENYCKQNDTWQW